MRHIVHAADGKKHVARIKRARGAGASRRSHDAAVVKQQKKRFALNALEAEVHVGRKPFCCIAVQCRVRDCGKTGNQAVTPCGDIFRAPGKACDRFPEGGCHGGNAGDVLCAGPLAALLRAAFNQIRKPDALLRVQEADTLRAVEFVSGSI